MRKMGMSEPLIWWEFEFNKLLLYELWDKAQSNSLSKVWFEDEKGWLLAICTNEIRQLKTISKTNAAFSHF